MVPTFEGYPLGESVWHCSWSLDSLGSSGPVNVTMGASELHVRSIVLADFIMISRASKQ